MQIRPGRHAPDGVADIVGHQQRALLVDGDADRPALRLALVVEEAGQDVLRLAGGLAVRERHEDHLVAAARGLRFHEPCWPMKAPFA